ncbi:MAG: hypothetical protein IPJ77_18350 [Planctomycetes bacterium]|nr:hypothetical protein [Planctomycetota bacterium]
MQPFTRLVALLAVAAPAWGSSFSVFVGPPGGVGFVRVYDESGVIPAIDLPELTDIRLVDLDLSSRAALEVVSDARARLRDDVPGASRLSLPNGSGSLYHFVRAAGTSRETWGFFVVGADRIARVVIELPAVVPGIDPFNARIAVAPDGLGLLVATARGGGAICTRSTSAGRPRSCARARSLRSTSLDAGSPCRRTSARRCTAKGSSASIARRRSTRRRSASRPARRRRGSSARS